MNQLTGYLVAFLADLGLNPEQAGVIAGLKWFWKYCAGMVSELYEETKTCYIIRNFSYHYPCYIFTIHWLLLHC